MGKIVSRVELNDLRDQLVNCCKNQQNVLQNLATSLESVSQNGSFQGATADSIKSYYGEVYGPLVATMELAVAKATTDINSLLDEFTGSVDSEYNALIKEDFLDNLDKGFENIQSNILSKDSVVRNAINEVSDIIDLGETTINSLGSIEGEIHYKIGKIKTSLESFDSGNQNKGDELKEIVDSIKYVLGTIGSTYSNGISINYLNRTTRAI